MIVDELKSATNISSTTMLTRRSSLFTAALMPTTSRGWLRTESDRRSSSATMIQLATSDDPPAARNGVVRPVSGMTRVTPPMTTKTCSATTNESPTPSRRPKSSCPAKPMRNPRETNSR